MSIRIVLKRTLITNNSSYDTTFQSFYYFIRREMKNKLKLGIKFIIEYLNDLPNDYRFIDE